MCIYRENKRHRERERDRVREREREDKEVENIEVDSQNVDTEIVVKLIVDTIKRLTWVRMSKIQKLKS